MDHGVTFGDVTQPQIKRDVAVPWGTPRIMIFGGAISATASIRLDRDQHVANPRRPENEIAINRRWVALGSSPLRFEVINQRRIKTGEFGAVAFDRPVDRFRLQPVDQSCTVSRKITDVMT